MKKLIVLFLFVGWSVVNALEVTTSILPQKYFIEKIAGDKVKVNVMVQKGFSPATYEPKTSQMKKLASSSIYFSIGVPFETVWLKRFKSANSQMIVVDTTKGIQKRQMEKHTHHDEHENEEAHHDEHEDEDGLDPHVWLDPVLVKIQAKNIYMTLVKYDVKNKPLYQKNYEQFIQELDVLYTQLKSMLAPVKGEAIMVFHPSWGYFSKRFKLEQIAVEIEGKAPKPNQLVDLIKEAKENGIKIVFVAPQFSQKSAKVIAQNIKGKVVLIDPLNEDWSEGLLQTAQAIVESYQ